MAPVVGRSSDSIRSHERLCSPWRIRKAGEKIRPSSVSVTQQSGDDEPGLWTRETEEWIVAFEFKACTPGSISLE